MSVIPYSLSPTVQNLPDLKEAIKEKDEIKVWDAFAAPAEE